jgi:hypothetical protein
MTTFADLGASFPLFEGPIDDATVSQNDVVFSLSEYDRRLRTPRPNMKGTT